MSDLLRHIAASVVGARRPIRTPFGQKPLIYADYTASGRSLGFIEDYLREHVMPWYANTHSESSYTGAQTTALRDEARSIVHRAVNGGPDDLVIFCGSGATTGINKVIDILGLRLSRDLHKRIEGELLIPEHKRPVVFVGPYEHHSNELPWRESIADVVRIELGDSGQLDLDDLRRQLARYADRELLIGSFSAASNVTGIRTDVAAVTALLKAQGALAFWDYAAAAPYTAIDMQGENPIDAAFVSSHKFVGGPGTPGLLLIKRQVLQNAVPSLVGGGTVLYVTPEDHRFLDDPERREEGGTPAVLESIRAGLVFKLQQEVGTDVIEAREADFVARAIHRLKKNPRLEILGDADAPRLSILSLRFRYGHRDLHYGFVVALLNDLFGLQVRGGCSCAGPYGHHLLGMDLDYSRAIEREIRRGAMILRPGWVRLNFNYFLDDAEFTYLLDAIELVAEHGWRLLPYYRFDEASGTWQYQGRPMALPSSLLDWSFTQRLGAAEIQDRRRMSLDGQCAQAAEELQRDRADCETYELQLSEAGEKLRWFTLPQEALAELRKRRAGRKAVEPLPSYVPPPRASASAS